MTHFGNPPPRGGCVCALHLFSDNEGEKPLQISTMAWYLNNCATFYLDTKKSHIWHV